MRMGQEPYCNIGCPSCDEEIERFYEPPPHEDRYDEDEERAARERDEEEDEIARHGVEP